MALSDLTVPLAIKLGDIKVILKCVCFQYELFIYLFSA